MSKRVVFAGESPFDFETPPAQPNPCVRLHGAGPEGAKCKTCTHLFAKQFSATYYKCDMRRNTRGPGTDHRVSWDACGKYEETN